MVNAAHGHLLAGRYRLDEPVGSGGAGTVWAAVDEVLGRRVAVKDVGGPRWLGMEGQDAVRERTMREARAAALIDHPNVVTVYDVIEVDGRPWIVMELIRARTLAQVVDEDGPCSPSETARIGLQVLGALRVAHRLGILHRDVKPSNVLIDDEDGRAVLTDFGIARMDGDIALTASGVLVGAPAFIAPERVRAGTGDSAEAAGPASDLWSLGATLYTAVEGRPPYDREGAIPTIAAVVNDEPDPVLRAGALTPVLSAVLRREPDERPTADELEVMLAEVAAGQTPVPRPSLAVAAPMPLPRLRDRATDGHTVVRATTGPNAARTTGPNAARTTGPQPARPGGPHSTGGHSARRHNSVPLTARDDEDTTQATVVGAAAAIPLPDERPTVLTAGGGAGRPRGRAGTAATWNRRAHRTRGALLFSAAGLLITMLVIGVLAELTGDGAERTRQPGGTPGGPVPVSEQPADGSNPGDRPSGGEPTNVAPAADVSDVGATTTVTTPARPTQTGVPQEPAPTTTAEPTTTTEQTQTTSPPEPTPTTGGGETTSADPPAEARP
ncbi:MAG TPA: protein kinase [Pseudonocardiaceae bacterium]